MSHETQRDPRRELREALVKRVFSLAESASRGLMRGDRFNVTIPVSEVRSLEARLGLSEAHYGEIVGELMSRSESHGYIFHAATGRNWTYGFTKA